jgi:hypothetical protein
MRGTEESPAVDKAKHKLIKSVEGHSHEDIGLIVLIINHLLA